MIEIRGLRKTFADGKEALRGIDLDIGDGMLGLLGPNGSGKTTFLSMLVLALEPTSGSRVYDGLDARRRGSRSAIRRMIGYLPQDFAPIGHLTGMEYLVHCARLRSVNMGRGQLAKLARELLDAVMLGDAAHRRSGEYSGGMRRRLGIAQALIHAPRLLVVDEPTAGLDPEERIRFRNLIADMAEETAVLLSTHIVEDIEATCSRVVIISGGQLLFDGLPTELLRACEGKLWQLRPGAEPPPGIPIVSRRVASGGSAAVVFAEAAVSGAEPHEPILEEAYGAFLLLRGIAISGEDRTP